jgi:AraC-like DNA-binding protein
MSAFTRPVPLPSSLAAYVHEIWVDAESPEQLSPLAPYPVLPGIGAVMGFQFRGRLAVRRGDSTEPLAVAGVTGLQSEVRWFVPREVPRSVLVRFTPIGAYALLGTPMCEVTDRHVPLTALSPAASQLERRIDGASPDEAAAAVGGWLLALAERRGRRDAHADLVRALGMIAATYGAVPIERVADRVGVGRRQLERLFREQVGVSPKAFASASQFNWTVHHLGGRRSWADVAAEAGYADQAHFIRSFKRRAGVTPGEYVRRLQTPTTTSHS